MATDKSSAEKKQSANTRGQPGPLSVAADLRHLIVDGTYKAGARITERTVAERFDCTAASTREAFHLLEKQGAIIVSARRGARVIDHAQAPPSEIFLVWDRLRWLLGEELRRHGQAVNGEGAVTSSGASRSQRLIAAEANLNRLGALAHNKRLAEVMARIALHVMIVAPDRFEEIEASLAR
ncbi:MAG: GntR family transcriptional regulator [Pseudomonadota bacterium]|nr:GntR family transcriptional regulator [Pseudomonadota bacterium]